MSKEDGEKRRPEENELEGREDKREGNDERRGRGGDKTKARLEGSNE